MALKYAHYPGCAAQSSAREVMDAMVAIERVLDLELVELTGASCCGAGVIRQANPELQIALNARTFAQAESQGLDILTPCATCQGNMWEDLNTLNEDAELRDSINQVLERSSGLQFNGDVRMRHLLHILVEDVGLDTLREKVVNPLDLPIAGYYGAPMLQRGASCGDDPWDPTYLESLVDALGGTSIRTDGRVRSVGFPSLMSQEKTALRMTAAVLEEAKNSGASVIVSACPLSHINLDSYQDKAGQTVGRDTDIPVVHLPEIVAWALGQMPDRFAYLRTRALIIGN